jgi:hypothetical protein
MTAPLRAADRLRPTLLMFGRSLSRKEAPPAERERQPGPPGDPGGGALGRANVPSRRELSDLRGESAPRDGESVRPDQEGVRPRQR